MGVKLLEHTAEFFVPSVLFILTVNFEFPVSRHQSNGAVISRCGQPEVSWWGWRNADDEHLVQSVAKACASDSRSNSNKLMNGNCSRDFSNGGDLSDVEFGKAVTIAFLWRAELYVKVKSPVLSQMNLLYLVPILIVGLSESCWNQCQKDLLSSSPVSSSLDSSISNASGAESLAIQPQKLLILDARSYAAAVANRAKGGGCECPGEQHSSSVFQ